MPARMTAAWWWIDRWRKSSAYTDMTAEEQGLYRNLLDEVWLRDDHIIPNDPRILAKVSGDPEAWLRVGAKVLKWMTRADLGWTHETALEVIHQSSRRAANQKRYRDRLNNARSNGAGNKPNNKPDSPSPSPSPSLSTLNPPKVLDKNTLSPTIPKNGNAGGNGHKSPTARQPKEPADGRVRDFLQWFQTEYKTKRHGADYLVKWDRDGPLVKRMLFATAPERLKKCAQILLSDKTDEPFIMDSDRGIGVLSAKFNWLSDRLAAWEASRRA